MARTRPALSGTTTTGAAGIGRFWTRRLTSYRGTTVNGYGDATNVGVQYLTGVPASIAETAQDVFDAASQRQQIIRTITCTVPAWADIVTTDTLYDPATGTYYMIESVEATPSIGFYPPPKILTLRVRSGVSTQSD